MFSVKTGKQCKRENFSATFQLMEFLYSVENEGHTLRETFDKLLEINRYVRQMAVTQQILAGFL